jgi:hypothetical protein
MPRAKKTAKPKKKTPAIRNTKATRTRALKELGINRPFYTCQVVGNQLRFTLYGGDVVFWPPQVKEDE